MKDVYEVDVELDGVTYAVTYYFKEKEREGVFNWLDPEGEEEMFEMMDVVPEVDGERWRELGERVRGDRREVEEKWRECCVEDSLS
jgi:hypothetical protein